MRPHMDRGRLGNRSAARGDEQMKRHDPIFEKGFERYGANNMEIWFWKNGYRLRKNKENPRIVLWKKVER